MLTTGWVWRSLHSTTSKLALLCAVPLAWDYRLSILLVVVVIASVGSLMSARYRYYSFVYHRVIRDSYGPGAHRDPS